MNRLIFFPLLLALTTPVKADDLREIYRQAQSHDTGWLAAQASRQAGIEKAPQGRAALLPSMGLSVGTSETNQHVKTTNVNDSYRYGTDGYSVQLSQPLYRKQNAAAYAQGISGANQAEMDLELARQDLILRVTQAYFAVLAAQDVLDFADTEKNAVNKQLALAKRNFNVGTATLVDVHEAQARYDLVVAQQITAANDLAVNQEALRVLTSVAPGTLARLTARLELNQPDPADMEKWVETAVNQSPRVTLVFS